MNSLSFMWGFYFLLSAVTALAATLAILATMHWAIPVAMVVAALPQLIATSHFSGRGWALENSLAPHYRLLSERQAANEVGQFLVSGGAAGSAARCQLFDHSRPDACGGRQQRFRQDDKSSSF